MDYKKLVYDQIINLIPCNVYLKDRKGRFLGCNLNQAKCDGFTSPDELVGKTVFETSKNSNIAKNVSELDELIMSNDTPYVIEEEGIGISGNIAIYITHKIPVHNEQKEVIGLLGLSIDITDKKESENLREKVQTMQMLGASIAHEIRNPLLAISSACDILQVYFPVLLKVYNQAIENNLTCEKIRTDILEELPGMLQIINGEMKSSHLFIDTLLSKIKEKPDTHDIEKCSISECIDLALQRYPFGTQENKDKVKWLKNDDFSFTGNKTMIIHVLFNLLKNALHYIGEAGKGEITLWIEHDDLHYYLHFKDTGTGISEEVFPLLFTRFFSKTRYGTGLGLAFCKNVMESIGGSIKCQSVLGEYTDFILAFPRGE